MDAFKTCRANDMERLVTDDMLFIHSTGNADNKAQFLEYVTGCKITDLAMPSDTNVRVYDGQAAIVTGDMTFETKSVDGTMVVTQVWVKANGAWRFASHHTTIPPVPR